MGGLGYEKQTIPAQQDSGISKLGDSRTGLTSPTERQRAPAQLGSENSKWEVKVTRA